MNRDEIAALRPSSELDMHVAARVLGCRVVVVRSIEAQVGAVEQAPWYACGCVGPLPHSPGIGETLYRYSIDPWAAWHVVEHMRANDWAFEIDSRHGANGGWSVLLDHASDPLRKRALEYAETMPLAICRASLSALFASERIEP